MAKRAAIKQASSVSPPRSGRVGKGGASERDHPAVATNEVEQAELLRTGAKSGPAGRRQPARKKAKPEATPASTADQDAMIEDLRRELEAAHLRIGELERRQAHVLDRIDWILDSLNTAVGSGHGSGGRRGSR